MRFKMLLPDGNNLDAIAVILIYIANRSKPEREGSS